MSPGHPDEEGRGIFTAVLTSGPDSPTGPFEPGGPTGPISFIKVCPLHQLQKPLRNSFRRSTSKWKSERHSLPLFLSSHLPNSPEQKKAQVSMFTSALRLQGQLVKLSQEFFPK